MARRGRKAKQAQKRYANGRIVPNRYPQPAYDKGSEWVQQRRERFGEHYSSALGRAYASGLLGDDAQAKNRLDTGKRFSALYSVFIEQGRYGCPLGREQRSTGTGDEIRGIAASMDAQKWLFDAMDDLDRDNLRCWLDNLLSEEFHDRGPVFLDRLLMGGRDPYDRAVLAKCIEALDCIATPAAEKKVA